MRIYQETKQLEQKFSNLLITPRINRTVRRGKTSCDFLLCLYLSTELFGAGKSCDFLPSLKFIHRHVELCGAGRHRVVFLFFSLSMHIAVQRGKTSCEFLLSLLKLLIHRTMRHRVIFYFLFIYPQNCAAWEDIVWFSTSSLFIHRTVRRGKTSCDFLLPLYLSTELCGVGRHRVIFYFLFIYPQNCAAWEDIVWFSTL